MKARAILLIVLIAFAITLRVIVGQRLSSEAMAVVVGVVAGVAASIPTSLIVVWVAMRSTTHGTARHGEPVRPVADSSPHLVVVQPQIQPAIPGPYPYPTSYAPASFAPSPSRQFTVLGGAELEDE